MKLVGLYEVSELLGMSRQAVANWIVRKRDFPQPLANLKSGPVWDAKTILDWLEKNTVISNETETRTEMSNFTKDQYYTMREIHAVVGGDTVSYLPQSGDRIVAGRFHCGEMNPFAPYKILVGDLRQVRRKAELLAKQGGCIPVFIKEASNRWRYHGLMRVMSYVTDPNTIASAEGVKDRAEGVAGILNFEDV